MAERRSSSRETEVVRQLIGSIRAGHPQDPIALAEAQERGFGLLMSMEAELQRAERAARDTAGPSPSSGAAAARVDELMDSISELTDALTELRSIAGPGDGPSKVGYGFVLPSAAPPRAGRPAGR